MRISLCNEVIVGIDFARQCEFVRAVGYDGIEIAPFTLGEEPHRLSPARRAEVGRIGVAYLLELLAREDTGFINTVEEAVAVVRAIGGPALRTMLDCSAAGRAEVEPIPDVLRRWLPTGLIAHIHLNDPNRRGPGEGALAFGPILTALKAQGYAGMAAIEPFIYEPNGPSCAARAIGYVRGLLEMRDGTAPRDVGADKA